MGEIIFIEKKLYMKVEIKKIHPSWNFLEKNTINVGDIVKLENNIIITKKGKKFRAKDLCMSFGPTCSYSDIFKKV